jgi:hypothetical protein
MLAAPVAPNRPRRAGCAWLRSPTANAEAFAVGLCLFVRAAVLGSGKEK